MPRVWIHHQPHPTSDFLRGLIGSPAETSRQLESSGGYTQMALVVTVSARQQGHQRNFQTKHMSCSSWVLGLNPNLVISRGQCCIGMQYGSCHEPKYRLDRTIKGRGVGKNGGRGCVFDTRYWVSKYSVPALVTCTVLISLHGIFIEDVPNVEVAGSTNCVPVVPLDSVRPCCQFLFWGPQRCVAGRELLSELDGLHK